jgi:hypothetical protein
MGWLSPGLQEPYAKLNMLGDALNCFKWYIFVAGSVHLFGSIAHEIATG